MSLCYCGSSKEFSQCCQPLLNGEKKAETAEELMRARYSAFVTVDVPFIIKTVSPTQSDKMSEEAVKRWAESSDWKELQIVTTSEGGKNDEKGIVEFIAKYMNGDTMQSHHERASFSKSDGDWFFEDGVSVLPTMEKRETPKVGRNDPCPCGSGKKYKKCCGRA
ncbi:YchJ family protein [bacterium]|nr:YchJ family protein [bacterium]